MTLPALSYSLGIIFSAAVWAAVLGYSPLAWAMDAAIIISVIIVHAGIAVLIDRWVRGRLPHRAIRTGSAQHRAAAEPQCLGRAPIQIPREAGRSGSQVVLNLGAWGFK